MPLTPEQQVIAAPYVDAAVEIFEVLKSDRGLAIKFARHHGLIPGDYVEPKSVTAEWLKNVLAASPACPHCGAPKSSGISLPDLGRNLVFLRVG